MGGLKKKGPAQRSPKKKHRARNLPDSEHKRFATRARDYEPWQDDEDTRYDADRW